MLTKQRSSAGLAVTALGLAVAAVAIKSVLPAPTGRAVPGPEREGAARRLNVAAALLAASALADSATEHYRGEFHNRIMILPLAVAAQALAASVHGAAVPAERPGSIRDHGYVLALATGVVGTGFHFYNIVKRPSGWSWLNLFYAAPLGAPIALSLSGVLGGFAERLRSNGTVVEQITGRLIARLVAVGLVGASGEAALMHFRGAYHNPAMLIPVSVPPVAAALLAGVTVSPRWHGAARLALRATAVLGLVGMAFHAYGVQRNMGGWRNWSQNILNGPPLPAPPSFTGLAIAGLGALELIERPQ